MMKSRSPVTASSFPKWKSNNQRHVVDAITGKEFYFEQDPLSLKWYDVTSEIEILKTEETNTSNKTKSQSSHNETVPVTLLKSVNTVIEIPPKPRKKSLQESKNKRIICGTSRPTGSMVDIMSLVKKHLNKSKTNVASRNANFKNVGVEFVRKNIKTENGMKSEIVSSRSTSAFESSGIKVKQKPSSSYTGQIEHEPSGHIAVEIEHESSGHIAVEIEQEPVGYYAGEIEEEPSNVYFANIREKHSSIGNVKIKQESSCFDIVKIKKEPVDLDAMQTDSQEYMTPKLLLSPPTSSISLDENISNTLRQPVCESQGTCITQSADVTILKTKHSFKQSKLNPEKDQFQSISLNKNDTLQNVKLELTRIDDIFKFENKSSVTLNSPYLTSKKPVKKDCSVPDRPLTSDKTVILDKRALELKYQCFSAEQRSEFINRPDPNVLYNKTKLCRHSNRFQNGETIECGCVRLCFLKCDLCGLVLRNCGFKEHVKTHYRIRRYRCPTCAKVYKCASQFDKHFRLNLCQRQKYQCFKCQEVFKKFCFLKRHLQSCTGNILAH